MGCPLASRIHTLMFLEQSCTLQFFIDMLVGVIVGWVVSVVESSRVLMLFVDYTFSGWKPLFINFY